MKVLFVLDSLNRGGAEMLALDVCRNAAACGLDLSVAAMGGGTLEDEFKNSGVPYFRLNRSFPLDLPEILKLRKIITKNDIDIVHGHQAVEGLHAYVASIGTRTKRVLTFHGHFPDAKNRETLKFLVPRVDANIVCSGGLKTWLVDQGISSAANFDIVYNGVDATRLSYVGPSIKEEIGVSEGSLLVGMVANFYPAERKDQLTLCRAFVRVAQQKPDVHLLLVGRVLEGAEDKFDECKSTCAEAGLSKRAHFLGFREDTTRIFSGLDINVLSSFHEGLPISLLEAMLSKTPSIVSDIEPHMEVSEKGRYAFTFRTGDASDLAEKILSLVRDRAQTEKLGGDAFEFAKETFSIEAHIASLKAVYQRIS